MGWNLWLDDLRFALRGMRRRPAFTLLVVATLALGLGVNGAVFALVDSVLLRPLPYPQPDRLVFVWQTLPKHDVLELEATPFDYAAWHRARSFSSLALVDTGSYTLTGDGADAERVHGARTTASIMPLLGIGPRLGRGFTPAEDDDGAARVAILGDGLWRRRFGADPGILGRAILVDGAPHTVVGVMAPGAQLPGPLAGSDDIWLPARMSPTERANPISHNYTVLARLADGVTPAQASAEMATLAATLTAEHPDTHTGLGARVVPIGEDTVRAIRPALLLLVGGVALLLLIACANVATLLVARAVNRRQEIAVRSALGATRGRLLSLAVVESVLLSFAGAIAGLGLSGWALRGALPLFAASLPRVEAIGIDPRIAVAVIATGILTGFVFGVVVSLLGPDAHVAAALRSGPRTAGAPRETRARSVLVVSQIALAVVLLATSGLMIRSVVRLSRVGPGFEPDRVLTFRLSLDGSRYAALPARAAFASDLQQRLIAAPGVSAAALGSYVPFGGGRGANGVEIEGHPAAPGSMQIADQRHVTPDYFRAMAIPVVRGRVFGAADDARGEPVTVINQTMAARFWPDADPIGQRIRLSAGFDSESWFRIVGIVADVHHVSLSRAPAPEMYRPYAQAPDPGFVVVVKTTGDPASAGRVVREAVQAIDRNLPVYDMRTMDERIAASFAETRATALLLLATAILAAVLAAVAIYGSIWYSVAQRIPEIGVRLALGASRASVGGLVVGRAAAFGAIGVAIGLAGSALAAPMMRGLLFDTRPVDPATYVGVAAGVLALTVLASALPARRAMQVDPMTALRNE